MKIILSTTLVNTKPSLSRDGIDFQFADDNADAAGYADIFDEESVDQQWKFYCDKFARSFAEIKGMLHRVSPGHDKSVIKQLNSGKDPIKVFSDFASKHVNVFEAVSSANKKMFLRHLNMQLTSSK
jgi:hypothetical protein